ncbi:RebB family R body protein [Aphanothece sacrum]|uniref:Glycerol-3-phosphate dehydrogenase subunit C n=1 Tax=Aphanothece sacrum FPU1 TaxID=1920663 RepID=A0A401ILG6_APHSA|nr:RebB family R body protein [Aphanothece sacrum]GBF82104.1 glycerol-3-phosphate dehydrogenase subunit C [Aphanothece sacrum FPU1]GBF85038.1 glycerol-3-phosphate dehydrogenase subunit C [Aphanothece sacrum FPU3]
MAAPEIVSTQVTDAVTQANVKVLAESPAMALSNLYQTVSQSLSLSAQNSVTAQQQSNIIHQTTTTQGVSLLYSVDTASLGSASGKALRADTPDVLGSILGVVEALKDIG